MIKYNKWILGLLLFSLFLLFMNGETIYAQNYKLKKSVIDQGGGWSQSTHYKLIDAVGLCTPIGAANSTNYKISSGFFFGGIIENPVLFVSPTTLNFGLDQTSLPLIIKNNGGGALSWNISESPDKLWITGISPTNGSLNGGESVTVTVTVDRSGLADGTYAGNITVSSDVDNQDVAVIVNVGECTAPYVAATDVSGGSGTHVIVDINIKDNLDPIDAFGLKLTFDTDKLSYVGAGKGDLSTAFDFFDASESPTGTVTIGAFHTSSIPAHSSGSIAKVELEVTCSGCSEGNKSTLHIHNLMDDLVGLNICDGTFTYMSCLLGDVNMDFAISPGDALCAFKIYLNGGIPEGECDNECALYASDANCDDAVSPGDALIIFQAYLDGLQPPLECPPASTLSKKTSGLELNMDYMEAIPGEEVTMSVKLNNAAGLDAFGFDLGYPDELLSFVKVSSVNLTEGWQVVDGKENAAGTVTIGGFNAEAINLDKSGALVTLTFKMKTEVEGSGDLWLFNLTDDLAGAEVSSGFFSTIAKDVVEIPTTYALKQNYPNPFNPETTIEYQLPQPAHVILSVYDMQGHEVRKLVSGSIAAGCHTALWDGRDKSGKLVASGVYFYRLEVKGDDIGFTDVKKMILMK